jgi:hypothetical protein
MKDIGLDFLTRTGKDILIGVDKSTDVTKK